MRLPFVYIYPGGSTTLTLRIAGAGPFEVRWSDGVVEAGVTSPVIRTVAPTETTTYSAQVIDLHGCENVSNSVTVDVGNRVTAALSAAPNPICASESSVLMLDIAGKAPFTIRWSDGVTQSTRQSTITRSVTPSDTTQYTAHVTDGDGCQAVSNSVTIQVNQPPFVTLSASRTRIIPDEVVTITAVPAGNAPFTLEWSDGFVQHNVTGVTTRQVAPLTTTTYNVTIIDRNGCSFEPPQGITIFVEQFRKISPISRAIINKYC
jgi:large repetitive protein